MQRPHNNRLVSSLRAAVSFSLHRRRLHCTTTAAANRFVAQSYLVASCGLTPSQALKASKLKRLAHLETPDRPDAVRAFLAGLGLSKADVASAIVRSPRLLCLSVDEVLAPRLAQLRGIGLSDAQIASLVPLFPRVLARPQYVSRLASCISFLGSFDKVRAAIAGNSSLLVHDLDVLVEPNIALLRQCGLPARDIAAVFPRIPRLLAGSSQEHVKAVIARAEELGVPRGTPMFGYALDAAYQVRREAAAAKMELLKSLGWSSGQVAMAVAKLLTVLKSGEDRLRRAMAFLTKDAGMGVDVIARRPALLRYSIEGRLAPRLNVLMLLKHTGSPLGDRNFSHVASMSDKMFLQAFKHPYGLTHAHAAARAAGKAPARAAS